MKWIKKLLTNHRLLWAQMRLNDVKHLRAGIEDYGFRCFEMGIIYILVHFILFFILWSLINLLLNHPYSLLAAVFTTGWIMKKWVYSKHPWKLTDDDDQ